jgi:hypothetical protein
MSIELLALSGFGGFQVEKGCGIARVESIRLLQGLNRKFKFAQLKMDDAQPMVSPGIFWVVKNRQQ